MKGKTLTLLALFIVIATLSWHHEAQPKSVSAAATLTIDDIYVGNERLNIKDMTYLGIHVSFSDTLFPLIGGKIIFEEIAGYWYTNEQGWCIVPVTSWEPGPLNLTIEEIYFGATSTDYEWVVSEPQAIFDRIDVELRSLRPVLGQIRKRPL